MKKFVLILTMLLIASTSQAQNRSSGVDGLIWGAGGGALIGQAIGRNTQATLIGSAVGTMLGYMVGNEMDKTGYRRPVTYRPPQVRYSYSQPRNVYIPRQPPRQSEQCRETEMLAEIDGQAEKVYGTACLQNGEWVITSPGVVSQRVVIKERRKHHRNNKKHHRGNYREYDDDDDYRYDRRVVYQRMW